MPTTMKLIAKQTLGSAAASVTFGSGGTIPQTYTDLLLLISARTTDSDGSNPWKTISIEPNGATTNRSQRELYGTGSAAASFSDGLIKAHCCGHNATANTFGNSEVYIPNYAGSTNKSFSVTSVVENNATAGLIDASAGLWAQTTAITSLVLFSHTSGNFVSSSSFFLYGITKA